MRPGGAGLPWEEMMWRGPNGFLLWEVVRGRVPAPGEAGDGADVVSGSCSPGCGSPGGACVEGGRDGRISSLRRWLPG